MNSSKTVLINSENRQSGTSSSFTYFISNEGNTYTHALVLGCNIPVSYYLIQEPYNTFTLVEEGADIVISIPEGNYNVNSFKNTVKTLLNAATQNSYVYDIVFENDYIGRATGKYTFAVTGFVTPPTFIFPKDGELHAQFGFTHSSTNVFDIEGIMRSTSVVNFIPETVLTISSDLCEDSNLLTIFHDNALPYSNISFQCQTQLYKKKLRRNAKDSLYSFSLLSKNGTDINLNGQPILLNILLFNDNDQYKKDIQNYIGYRINH
jgi:hypothetical protein